MNKQLIIILGAIIIPLLLIIPHANAQTSDFSTGYSDGNQQGLSDRHANVFHIGNVCINQSNSYCNGYLSGYLDGFFATLPTNTHTTIIVRRGGGDKEPIPCHIGNMTIPCPPETPKTHKCPDGSVIPITDKCPTVTPPGPTPTPKPGPSAPSGPSTPSTPSTPSSPSGGSPGSSSSPQPTIKQ